MHNILERELGEDLNKLKEGLINLSLDRRESSFFELVTHPDWLDNFLTEEIRERLVTEDFQELRNEFKESDPYLSLVMDYLADVPSSLYSGTIPEYDFDYILKETEGSHTEDVMFYATIMQAKIMREEFSNDPEVIEHELEIFLERLPEQSTQASRFIRRMLEDEEILNKTKMVTDYHHRSLTVLLQLTGDMHLIYSKEEYEYYGMDNFFEYVKKNFEVMNVLLTH